MIFPARVFLLALSVIANAAGLANAQAFAALEDLDVPVSGVVEEPSLTTLPDGRLLMTWTELMGPTHARLWMAIRDDGGWSEPVLVTEGDDLFVNYADFPSAIGLADGTIAVQWLRLNGSSSYAYDVNIALSPDDGATWGDAIVPHRDGLARQHGFVSLLPDVGSGILAMWLDGRSYDTTGAFAGGDDAENAMQLHATTLSRDGDLSQDLMLDERACTCCQTSAAVAGDGTVLLAFRDRTEDEIRDISVVRRVDGIWTDPVPVSGDGWEIAGCPVNGPAIDARGDAATLVWFTAADGVPAVRMAFSDDSGASFGAPLRIDLGGAVGRVDLMQLEDGAAIVTWLENTAAGETLFACRATATKGCGQPSVVTINRAGRTMGFPRMALADGRVHIAWSEPTVDVSSRPDGGTTIRAVMATLAPVE